MIDKISMMKEEIAIESGKQFYNNVFKIQTKLLSNCLDNSRRTTQANWKVKTFALNLYLSSSHGSASRSFIGHWLEILNKHDENN